MKTKRIAAIGLISLAVTGSTVSTAKADGGTGFTSVVIGRGQVNRSTEREIEVEGATDVVTAQNTITPGGASGWHSHPGATVIVVQSGELTLYTERVGGGPCLIHTYKAGQVFFELPQNQQNAVNIGATDAVVAVTFFNVPHAGSPRIDRPNPANCP